ncbi:positive regulator of cytochrome C genes CYC1 and CYC7, partial [Scheffersomyces stipitis CBS 6054]
YRKRHRIPASCSICRKRKSKCDRVRPVCGTCKKKSIAHLCYYESDKDNVDDSGSLNSHVHHLPEQPPGPPQHLQHPPPQFFPPPPHFQPGVQPQLQPPLHQNQMDQLHQHPHNPQQPIPQQHIQPQHITAQQPAPSQPIPQQSIQSQQLPHLQANQVVDYQGYQGNVNLKHPDANTSKNAYNISAVPATVSSANSVSAFAYSPTESNISMSSANPPSTPGKLPSSFSNNRLVSIPLGPNSSLQVNPDDTMKVFSNASYALNLEGPLWQYQGVLSYIGLTKSDPFIKIMRNYAILLFKSGEMGKFMKLEAPKTKKRSAPGKNTSPGAKKSRIESSLASDSIHESPGSYMSECDSKKDVDVDHDNILEDDGLITTRIDVVEQNSTTDKEEESELESRTEIKTTDPAIKKEPEKKTHKRKTNPHAIPNILPGLKSLYSGKKNRKEYYELVEKAIIGVFPSKLNMFMLFCRFFKYVHPFAPIIDENSLMMDITTLLQQYPSFNHGFYDQVIIESDHDLTVLGIFLLVLRLGYMSLIHNDPVNNSYTKEEQGMVRDMRRISTASYLNVVDLCLADDLICTKSTFRKVQSLTLLYFFRKMSPDDCHGIGGTDSNILLGVAITHAFSIGLNRDPTCYGSQDLISKREPLIRIWRSLWNYLITSDVTSAIHSSTPLKVASTDVFDVKLPSYSEDSTGTKNDTINKLHTIVEGYRNIIKKMNNIQDKPKVIDILMETNNLEKIFFSFFGKDFFKDCICKPAAVPSNGTSHDINSLAHQESYMKVIKYCLFIQLRTDLSCMYYMIAIHYENEYNESQTPSMNAGIELFKIYIKSVVQLVYIMSYVLDNSVELFGKNYDYVLTSNNERCIIKTHAFLTSFFVRLLHHKIDLTKKVASDPTLQPRLEILDTLFMMVLIEAEFFVGNFRKLSKNYINSYKLYVMTYFVLKQCMDNPMAFFEATMYNPKFFHEGTNMLEFFTNGELTYLCKLCQEFRGAKEEQSKKKTSTRPPTNPSKEHFKYPAPLNNVDVPISFDPSKSAMSSNASAISSNLQQSPGDLSSFSHSTPEFGYFSNGHISTEDLLKLFEMYGDLDHFDV